LKSNPTRAFIRIAVCSAASALGGLIKIPSPVGSIALDSLPGYFAAGYFSPLVGAVVGFVGHLGSAVSGGLPLGALHILIASLMFLCCFLFGFIVRTTNRVWGLFLASFTALAANSSIPMICSLFGLPLDTVKLITPFVFIASAVNIALAAFAIRALSAARIKGI
jgi:uncharacterized membrane protein